MPDEETFDPLETADDSADNEELKYRTIKKRINNVLSDYRNAVDVLAEPVQNAMDAIVRADDNGLYDNGENPEITVKIDTEENVIAVEDNGRGFPYEELKQYIAPEVTNKEELFEEGKVRGHKGVGLTFLAYGFNYFEVESVLDDDAYRVVLEGSRTWAESDAYDADSRPQAEANHCDSSELQIDGQRGTRIEIHTDELSNPSVLSRAFNTAEMTKTILETQTAIGVLPPVSDEHVSVNVKLDYPSNDESPFDVDDQYRCPHQKINDDLGDGEPELETVNIGDYDYDEDAENAVDGILPEDQNRYHGVYKWFDADDIAGRFQEDHLTEEFGDIDEMEEFIKQRSLTVYVLYTYSNEYRNELRERWDVKGTRKFHSPGVRIGTDGMISTWYRPVNLSFSAPRETRLWFVYHFLGESPDTGREDFSPKVHSIVSQTEQFLHKATVTEGKTFLRPTPSDGETFDDVEPVEKAIKKDDLSPRQAGSYGQVPQVKEPDEEQDSIAVFNQLVGMGLLKCYEPYYLSTLDDYDGFLKYNPDTVPSNLRDVLPGSSDPSGSEKNITVEFKREGVGIIKHVVNETRKWSEMDLLVCWKLGGESDGDSSIDASKEWGGDEITFRQPTSQEDRLYAGVTHIAQLVSKGDVPLHTIELSSLIENFDVQSPEDDENE